MPLTNEQAKQIKEQLLSQISKLPSEQQEQAKKYISAMNNSQLEQFLAQNKLAAEQGTGQEETESGTGTKVKCVFCSIASKEMQALALYEDKDYLAVLEIKPYSNGHTILIPKKHITKTKSIPSKAYTISNRIGKHLIKKLKAESFQITTSAEMNHAIINIIPVYKKQPLTYERKQTKSEELQKLAMKIGSIEKRAAPLKKPKLSKEEAKKAIIKLQRRIP